MVRSRPLRRSRSPLATEHRALCSAHSLAGGRTPHAVRTLTLKMPYLLHRKLDFSRGFTRYQETFFRMSSFTARANTSAAITAQVSSESETLLLDEVAVDLFVDIGTSPRIMSDEHTTSCTKSNLRDEFFVRYFRCCCHSRQVQAGSFRRRSAYLSRVW
jgi:hypothetical protein